MTLTERDIDFGGVNVHLWEGGSGQPLLMLHGSGIGASTMGNFRHVIGPLAQRHRLLAADLVGFGQSGRKPAGPYFDVEYWLEQAAFLIGRLPGEQVMVIGHSLSGALALKLAARHPRVAKVVTTGTMGSSFQSRVQQNAGWTFPETGEQLRRFVESTTYDKSVVVDEEIDYRLRIIRQPGYREYFKDMFSKGRQHYIDATALSDEEISRLQKPVLLMHGLNDASFSPEETTLKLVASLPRADALLLGQCGHSVALEKPRKFLDACQSFFAD